MYYSKETNIQSYLDYRNVVIPFLATRGFSTEQIMRIIPRVQWGIDFSTFTIRDTDNITDPTDVPEIEKEVRSNINPNKLVLQAYLHMKGTGPILSVGIIKVNILSKLITNKLILIKKLYNRKDSAWFNVIGFEDIIKVCKPTEAVIFRG